MAYTDGTERGTVEAAPAPEHDPAVGGGADMPTHQSKRSPAFQFYPKDYLSSSKVQRMSLTERGAYMTLLSHCWLDAGLPNDMAAIAQLVGMKAARFTRMWTSGPLHECFYEKDGKLQNRRLDVERKIQADFRRKQRERADQRWHPKGNGNAAALPSTGNALLSPISYPQSPSPNVRHAPLVARRRLDAAWEGPKGLYVPQRKHSDFIQLRNHPGAEAELLAWYGDVAEAWEGSPGADMMKFWTDRYGEKWPAPVKPKVDDRRPAWMRQ